MLLSLFYGIIAFAQTNTVQISGTVTDFDSGETIIGANVIEKGSTNGTITDNDGQFFIKISRGKELEISCIGYVTQTITVSNASTLNVQLRVDRNLLDEIVVVGFATQKKVNLAGSITTVSKDIFENRPVSNVGQALQGVVPNLNITISDGSPEEVPSFNIRGGTTITSGSVTNGAPLILVDGVELSSSLLNQMNPNDIESMTVIKDASAAAIYGTKATFGVILVTTKGGRFNQKGKITYGYELACDSPTAIPDIMSSADIIEAQMLVKSWTLQGKSIEELAALGNDPTYLKWQAAKEYINNPSDANRYYLDSSGKPVWVMNNNPYELGIRKVATTQKHNVTLSGGSEKVAYYLSLGYQNQEGLYKINNDVYDRYNATARFTAKVTDWFKIDAKFSYNRTKYDSPYVASGKGTLWAVAQREADKNIMMPIKTLETDPAANVYTDNYLAWMSYGARSVSTSQTTSISVNPELSLIKDILKAKAELSFTPQSGNSERRSPAFSYITPSSGWTTVCEQAAVRYNTGMLSKSNTDTYLINTYFDYNQTFAKNHHLSAILGYSQEKVSYSAMTINMERLLSADILNPSYVEDKTLNTSSTAAQQRTARSVFGRLNYNYKDKYIFEVNGRYDGSSRFTPEERFVFFPSYSVAWRISEEPFFAPLRKYIDNFKVRASYGKLGSQPSSYYPYQATMAAGTASFILDGVQPTYVSAPSSIRSPKLTWEKAATRNIGIDVNAFKQRLDMSLDVFRRNTTDILLAGVIAYPSVLGVSAPNENSGEIQSNGWELDIKWRDNIGKVFYNIGFNLADAVTKVITYPSNPTKAYSSLYEGMTVGEIWGYTYGGILQNEDLELVGNKYVFYGPHPSTYTYYPGYSWYQDINGDGIISSGSGTVDNPGDMSLIGNTTPRYKFGLYFGLEWNGLDFNMFFQGVAKRDYWISSSNYWGTVGQGGSQWMWDRAWTPDRTDAAFPMYGAVPSVCDAYLVNASYMRLKQAVLGYTVPQAITRKIKVEKIRFNVSGYNLFTISQIPELFDPDQMTDAYPQRKTITFGAQITF